ncbi:HAMP domain-containing histidine kinase (plasmid) [Priestia megaterium]|uniref:sensor histidine kinase n=1 Tax=Priestia megaterium TaxID=1404 RepID=UPI001EDB14EF|nr:HAMP domain-containing sensor histidine kinase [Priestia megaterium]UKJ83963.1 HAMP domain-containing histidine kinase [Priestia megaterium]
MNVKSIVWKLGLTIMLLFLIVLLPFGFSIYSIFSGVYSTQVHENVNELSLNLSKKAIGPDRKQAEFYEYLSTITEKDIVLVDKNGKVLSTNHLSQFKKGVTIPEDLYVRLRESEHFERGYTDPKTKEYFFTVGRPILEENKFKGGILVFASIDEIHRSLHNVRNWILITIIGSIFLALGFTLFVSKKLSSPLIKMEKATRAIAKGNLDTKVNVASQDEVGSLAKAINDLSIELNNYRKNRSEFLANISHELRTPTSYLKGYAQLLRKHQYKNKEELESYSSIIESEAERLAKLIQDLFELSKMEEGRLELYLQHVDVEEIIEQSVRKVMLKAKEKNLDLSYHIDDELPLIFSDGSRIEQVLFNLLENAVNYTEKGSIYLSAWTEKDHVCILIQDTGIGIPEDELPFIFDRFHRVEKSRSRKMGGTGLGLSIVSEIIKLLKGSIEVQSKGGNGTSFLIHLPLDSTIEESNHER